MEWKSVKGYEELYEVSDLGQVRSKQRVVRQVVNGIEKSFNYKSKILKQEKTNRNYFRITLSKNNIQERKSVHRLVATAFLENQDNLPQVNHKDGNTENNKAVNLEWCTQSENQKHAFRTGLQLPVKGENHGNCKLSNESVLEIRSLYATGNYTQKQIADRYGIIRQHVSDIVLGKKRIL